MKRDHGGSLPRFFIASITDSGCGIVQRADDPAVGQEDHPVGVARRHRVVGDHDHRLAELADAAAQQRPAPPRRPGSRGCRWARRRRRSSGRLASARAIATRCCCPPDSSAGRCRSRRGQPHRLDDRGQPRRVRGAARDVERQRDVVARGQRRQQVVGLEDEPDPVAAQPGELPLRAAPLISVPPIQTCPEVAASRPAMQCIRVDLPEPEGPIIAVKEPAGMSRLTPVQRGDGRLALSRRPSPGLSRGAGVHAVVGVLMAGPLSCWLHGDER